MGFSGESEGPTRGSRSFNTGEHLHHCTEFGASQEQTLVWNLQHPFTQIVLFLTDGPAIDDVVNRCSYLFKTLGLPQFRDGEPDHAGSCQAQFLLQLCQ